MSTKFSIITTAKNEKNEKMVKEVFENWELTIELFESDYGFEDSVEVIIADAGGNVEFPKLSNCNCKTIPPDDYESIRVSLCEKGAIKKSCWDSQSIGRNIAFTEGRPKGDIIINQDIDSMFSTGTKADKKYINSRLDSYSNYLSVMWEAFKNKNIVAAAPSLRAADSSSPARRFAMKGQNLMTYFSTKLPVITLFGYMVMGPSVPGCSICVKKEFYRLYDPEMAIAEDYKYSRSLGKDGKISYEKKAGVFVRTLNRVRDGKFETLRSLLFGLKWVPHYFFPGYVKYKKYTLSV